MTTPVVMRFIIRRSGAPQPRITGIRPVDSCTPMKDGDELLELTQSQIDRMYQIEWRILQLREQGDSWSVIAETLDLDGTIGRSRALLAIAHAVNPHLKRYARPSSLVKRHE